MSVVFEELAEAVEKLSVPVDGAALVQVLRLRDRLDARIAEAVAPSMPPHFATSMPPPP
ncbi:MAG: hypothetical protein M3066_17440 [Actinomycetota bacterium]|nr:hypothetical protein [Actinomycetota bacterium]